MEQNNVETVVKQLKSKGYRLSTIHWRNVKMSYDIVTPTGRFTVEVPVAIPLFEIRRKGLNDKIMSKGGYTTMRLTDKIGDKVILGESRCHNADSFNNKLGFIKAFNDVLSKLPPDIKNLL